MILRPMKGFLRWIALTRFWRMKISERNMISMERKVSMTINREDSMRVGTTTVMTLVSVHLPVKLYKVWNVFSLWHNSSKMSSFFLLICFWPGIYDDDFEIITLDRGDFGKTGIITALLNNYCHIIFILWNVLIHPLIHISIYTLFAHKCWGFWYFLSETLFSLSLSLCLFCVSEAAVNSGEVWFINFYSPRCSHCHQLAPTVTTLNMFERKHFHHKWNRINVMLLNGSSKGNVDTSHGHIVKPCFLF